MLSRIRYTLLVLFLICISATLSAERLPVKAFASLPDVSRVKLSPSGNKVMYVSRYETEGSDGTLINIVDFSNNERTIPVSTDNKKFKILWAEWAGDDRILVSAIFPAVRYGTPTTETRLMMKDLSVSGKKANIKNVLNRSFYKGLSIPPQIQDDVIDFLPNDKNSILLSVPRDDIRAPAVYNINLNSRKRKLVQRGKANITDWITDRQNRVRAGVYWKDTTFRIYVKGIEKGAKWRELERFESFSEDSVWPIGFDEDPNILYVRAYHDGREAIFKTDISTPSSELELVYSDDNYDVDGRLIYSHKAKAVIGTTYSDDGGFSFWHPEYQALQRGLNKALPDTNNYIVSFSDDETRYILLATSDTEAGRYYLGDRKNKSLTPIASQYSQLPAELMAQKRVFKYKARDGLDIEGYISYPNDRKEGEKLPSIIFPHGGPISYDSAGFDYWAQFFVNRGYAVLQMNFRGSSGYGYNFMKMGLQNWGKAMQDDVEDGARALIAEGIADPQNICIAGASYGGYASLMGVVKTPDLYKCAISFAGVTDVNTLVQSSRRYTNHEIVKQQIGSKRSLLKEVSPVNHADKIRVPVLLIHGEADRSVPVRHSKKMYKKLKSVSADVEYLEIQDGDHYLSKEEHRIMTFEAMDAFLAKHLPLTAKN